MLRRLLQFIVIYAVIAIAVSAVFLGVDRVCSGTYKPDASDVFRDGETPLKLISLRNGCACVLGYYTEGANAGTMYYKVYDQNGTPVARQDFYVADTQVKLSSLLPTEDGFRIVCLCTPWDQTQNAYGAVFSVDGKWQLAETEFYRDGGNEEYRGNFDRFTAADNTGDYYAGIEGGNVTLFGKDGGIALRLPADLLSRVEDVAVFGDTVLLAGVDTESILGNNFRYALCAAYSLGGSLRWQKSLMDNDGTCSALLRAETGDDGFLLTGRSVADSSEGWHSTSRIDGFIADDDPYRFHIGPDAAAENASTLFIVKLSASGDVTGSAVYTPEGNEYVPSVMQYDFLSESSPLVLSTYHAEKERAKNYGVTVLRADRSLNIAAAHTLTISGDTVFYLTQDITGSGFFFYLSRSGSGQYKLLHFTSMSDAVNHMETVKKLRRISDYNAVLRQKVPALIVLGFTAMLCVSGAARYRGRQKKK